MDGKMAAPHVFVALPGIGLLRPFRSMLCSGSVSVISYIIDYRLATGRGIHRHRQVGSWVGISALLPLLFVAAVFFLLQSAYHADIIGGIRSYIDRPLLMRWSRPGAVWFGASARFLKQYSAQIVDVSIRIIPATVAISTFFVVIGKCVDGKVAL
jgi:hypothetical protein